MATLVLGTNSYVDQSEADAYTADMGLDAITDDQLLIRATKWVDRNYAGRFIGFRALNSQALNWPRASAVDVYSESGRISLDSDGNFIDLNSIPPSVKEAVIEVALLLQDESDVYAQPTPAVTEESTEIDVLKSTKKYSSPFQAKTAGDIDLYKIELILRPVLRAKGAIKLVR